MGQRFTEGATSWRQRHAEMGTTEDWDHIDEDLSGRPTQRRRDIVNLGPKATGARAKSEKAETPQLFAFQVRAYVDLCRQENTSVQKPSTE